MAISPDGPTPYQEGYNAYHNDVVGNPYRETCNEEATQEFDDGWWDAFEEEWPKASHPWGHSEA